VTQSDAVLSSMNSSCSA